MMLIHDIRVLLKYKRINKFYLYSVHYMMYITMHTINYNLYNKIGIFYYLIDENYIKMYKINK